MACEKPQEQIRGKEGMMNLMNLKYSNIKDGIDALENNVLESDLKQHFASSFSE